LVGVGHASRHRQHLTELAGIELLVEHDEQQHQPQKGQIPALQDLVSHSHHGYQRASEALGDETRNHTVGNKGIGHRNSVDNLQCISMLGNGLERAMVEYVGILRHDTLFFPLQK